MRTQFLASVTLVLLGCTELTPQELPRGSSGSVGGAGGAASGGSGGGGSGGNGQGGGLTLDCTPKPEPALPPEAMCDRVMPGAAGPRSIPLDLSAAHAGIRFFGPIAKVADADQALAAALLAPDALDTLALTSYADALPGVACALPAASSALELPVAEVHVTEDHVALIRPGSGPIDVPSDVVAVVVDLRDLPPVEGLRDALDAAVAPALAKPVARLSRRVRRHYGMTDEQFSPFNLYKNTIAEVAEDPIPATSPKQRKLALLTSATMAPETASFAWALRVANQALIVGESLRADVAESRWQGIGATGLAYRTADLIFDSGERLPDSIPADRRLAEPACIVHEILDAAAPAPIMPSAADRPMEAHVDVFNKRQPPVVDLGTGRAALITAHGAMRTFFPYFGVVPDAIDDRLIETLGTLGKTTPDRLTLRNILRRFANALEDSHTLVRDYVTKPPGSFPSYLEWINGEAVVRQTLAVGVNPGDTLTSIGGVPASEWYALEMSRSSGATLPYRFVVASYEVQRLMGPIDLGFRDPDGMTKTLAFQPQPLSDFAAVGFTPTLRSAGWLNDLGAPNLYYINLTGEVLYDMNDFYTQLGEAMSADGLVLDMRGFPGIDMAEVAQRLIPDAWSGGIFRIPVHTGPDDVTIDEYADTFDPLDMPSYAGPIVLIVGNGTLSAAEHFSLALVDAKRVTVVGRTTAGTDGNITGIQLPGQFAISFTGMDVRHADPQKSTFHGVGIVPDIPVELSAQAFRDGIDPELEAAVTHLLGP